MSDLNEVVISGRLTRDSELRYTPSGTAVTDVVIASNRNWSKDGEKQEETTFVDVTIWGKQAESLHTYLVKGRHLMIVGRLKLNKWETEEGDKRSKLQWLLKKLILLHRVVVKIISHRQNLKKRWVLPQPKKSPFKT